MRSRGLVFVCFATLLYFGITTQKTESLGSTFTASFSLATEGTSAALSPSEHWIVAPPSEAGPFSFQRDVEAIGQIRTIEKGKIVYVSSKRQERSLDAGISIVFFPPIDSVVAEAFCQTLQNDGGDVDKALLCNGDELEGEFVRMDARRLYFIAFDREIAIPRYRVRALRIAAYPTDK